MSLFPTNQNLPDNVDTTTNPTVNFGSSWQFDFVAGEFVQTPSGQIQTLNDVDAWAEWCKKAIATARYKNLAYSRNYGQEFEDLIGKGYTRLAVESEIERMTREALMIDPRTQSVEGFFFTWHDNAVSFTCTITNVLDEQKTINSGSVVMI